MSHCPRLMLQEEEPTEPGRLAIGWSVPRGYLCFRELEVGRGDRHTARSAQNAFQGLQEKPANYCSKPREFSIKT